MKKLKYSAENSPQAWLYLLPALIIILVFHVYPLIKTFIISFEKGTLNNLVFNGIRNYQIVLSDPKFHKAILNTTLYSFTVVPVGVIIAMIISLIIFEKIKHKDIIKGNVDFPENDQDIIIIKSDGLPTYHFAHMVDDHLMRTTHVIRGDEWLPSVPLHVQLFKEAGFKAPKYCHISPMMKNDNGNKRKLSKRKDPEAAVSYYDELGVPPDAVKEYLLNIANSTFENWRRQNKDANIEDFDFHLNKMSVSGALFDMVKLFDVAKIVISRYSAEKVYNDSYAWAKKYDEELVKLLENKDYALKVLGIERGNAKPRKDIAKWSDLKENISYMYNEEFDKITEFDFGKVTDKELANKISKLYSKKYFDINDDKQTWFDKMKDLAEEVGFAREVKEWKADPEKWPGHVGDISSVIRSKLTGRLNTPDLYEIIKVLGKDEVLRRLTK